MAWLKERYEEKDSVLEKKVFDTLRGLLPMAMLGQVAFRGNAQALEYLVNRSAKHGLGELRWLSQELKTELDKEIPSLLLRVNDQKSVDYQEYLSRRKRAVRQLLGNTQQNEKETANVVGAIVRLVEFDPEAERKMAAGIIFEASHTSWEEALSFAKKMSAEELKKLFGEYLSGRTARWQKVGRAFENSYLRFEITMDAGAYRDLHRHRMMTQERQLFSTRHGYDVPEEVKAAGLGGKYSAALEKAVGLFRKIESSDSELAQYAVPLAYRVRFYEWQNFRQLFWEAELRTISQGHPNYRRVEQEKYRLVKEKFPLLSEFMLVDMNEYDFARRGADKQIKDKEERILKGLKWGNS